MKKRFLFSPRIQPAFTLLETLLAVSMMAIFLTAFSGILYQALFWIGYHKVEFQAIQIAEEGLEAMRWMVLQNEAQNYSWHEGAALWGQNLLDVDQSEKVLSWTAVPCPRCYILTDESPLELGGAMYDRRLRLRWEKEGLIHVTSQVVYDYRGREYRVAFDTFLSSYALDL